MSTPSTPSPALQIALAYHQAWTSGDLDTALTHLADDLVCLAPAGRMDGAAAFRGFMAPFVQGLVGANLVACFGDETTAALFYDTRTRLVADAPGGRVPDRRGWQDHAAADHLRPVAVRCRPAGRSPHDLTLRRARS